jgi:hypothetical protein
MNQISRLMFAVYVVVTPWLAFAQGVDCSTPHASSDHRQSSCGSATASQGFDTGSSDGLFHLFEVRNQLTPACRTSANEMAVTCSGEFDAAKRRCWQTKLPEACRSQIGLLRAQRSPICEKQIFACENEASNATPACWKRALPSNCMEEMRVANRAREDAWPVHTRNAKCNLTSASSVQGSVPCTPPAATATASASASVVTGSSDGLFHFSRVRDHLTPACRDGTDKVIGACASEGEEAKRRCWQARLSATCQAQTGQLRARRDAVCEQQISTCERESIRQFPGCVQRELPVGCMEQIRAVNRANDH